MYAIYSDNIILNGQPLTLKTGMLYKVDPDTESKFKDNAFFFEVLEDPIAAKNSNSRPFVIIFMLSFNQETGSTFITASDKILSVDQLLSSIPENLIPVTSLATRTKTNEMINNSESMGNGAFIICMPENVESDDPKAFSKLVRLSKNDIITIKTKDYIIDGMFDSLNLSHNLFIKDPNDGHPIIDGTISIRPIIKANNRCYISARPIIINIDNNTKITNIEYIHSI